jgi:hypothetical protein
MFDRRHLAASLLGVLLVAPLGSSGAQEKRTDPKRGPGVSSYANVAAVPEQIARGVPACGISPGADATTLR